MGFGFAARRRNAGQRHRPNRAARCRLQAGAARSDRPRRPRRSARPVHAVPAHGAWRRRRPGDFAMSKEAAEHDLSGIWHGFYNMPNGRPTQFEATIRDAGGMLSGIPTEIGETRDCAGDILHAVIDGRCDGSVVRFEKRYDYLPRAHYVIHYEGALQSGGDEIEGSWRIPRVWSGTFLMVRGARETQAAERTVEEIV